MKIYKMEYFKAEDKLIQYNPLTKVYKIRNTIDKENKVISSDDFAKLKKFKINKVKFCTLMNVYFKKVKESWQYQGKPFRKLDNFEFDKKGHLINYDYSKLPRHHVSGSEYYGDLFLVYHWGHVYYFTWSYNGYPQGRLINPSTMEVVRWAKPKNCAPIFDEIRKKII